MSIIISAIVSLLIFFFEQWWTHHHPAQPNSDIRELFVTKISGWRYIWMGPNRGKYAGELFDKFVNNYQANPPRYTLNDALLTQDQAKSLATKYAEGLDL